MGVWTLPAPWATLATGVHSSYIIQKDGGQGIIGQWLFWGLSQALREWRKGFQCRPADSDIGILLHEASLGKQVGEGTGSQLLSPVSKSYSYSDRNVLKTLYKFYCYGKIL